jgi:hypothetical protein
MTDLSFEAAMKEVPLWVFKAFSSDDVGHIFVCPMRVLDKDGVTTIRRFYASRFLWMLSDLGCDTSEKSKLVLTIDKERICSLYEDAEKWARFLDLVNEEYNQPVNQQRQLMSDEDFWWLDTDI